MTWLWPWCCLPLPLAQLAQDVLAIAARDLDLTGQPALAIGGLAALEVVLVDLAARHLAAARHLEALLRAAVRLHLGHRSCPLTGPRRGRSSFGGGGGRFARVVLGLVDQVGGADRRRADLAGAVGLGRWGF